MFTLQDKFNLKCSIHYNRDNKSRIYIFKESMDNLITLVKPYFIKEMLLGDPFDFSICLLRPVVLFLGSLAGSDSITYKKNMYYEKAF